MPCFHPLAAYQCSNGEVVFSDHLKRHDVVRTLDLPCGRCVGCRLERSRQWAVRCMHEASMHRQNCFITLTYDEARLPADRSLHYPHFQNFMKRLRKDFRGQTIRFYMGGEYGEETARPHYHACIFGIDFQDRRPWQKTPAGDSLDRSERLERLWGHGICTVGNLTFESAAYVARYIMKKVTGDLAEAHYQGRTPEFNVMSRKPGIGSTWLEKYHADVYPRDFVVVNGKEAKPPRYYDKFFKKANPDAFEQIQWERQQDSMSRAADNTNERLAVREQVTNARIGQYSRSL